MRKLLLTLTAAVMMIACDKSDDALAIDQATVENVVPQSILDLESSSASKAGVDPYKHYLLDDNWTLVPRYIFQEGLWNLTRRDGTVFLQGPNYSTYISFKHNMFISYKHGTNKFYAWTFTTGPQTTVTHTGESYGSVEWLFERQGYKGFAKFAWPLDNGDFVLYNNGKVAHAFQNNCDALVVEYDRVDHLAKKIRVWGAAVGVNKSVYFTKAIPAVSINTHIGCFNNEDVFKGFFD